MRSGASEPVFYGTEPSQFVQFYPAAPDAGAPLVVMIHGGFWRVRFGLDRAAAACEALWKAGFTVANLEYRRVGEAGGGWPGTLDDVRAGVAFARDRAKEFGGDASKTVVMGHSAGGHLALWVAAEIPDLTRAIGLGAVANLRLAYSLGLSNGAVVDFLGGTPEQVGERYAAADPARNSKTPRVLIHGDADDIVPVRLSREFGAPAKRIEIPGTDHFGVVDPQHEAWELVLEEVSWQMTCQMPGSASQ